MFDHLYHCSFAKISDFNLHIYRGAQLKGRCKTKRICFSESLGSCVTSIPHGRQALHCLLDLQDVVAPILYVYSCRRVLEPDTFILPEVLAKKNKVRDALYHKEWCVLKVFQAHQ